MLNLYNVLPAANLFFCDILLMRIVRDVNDFIALVLEVIQNNQQIFPTGRFLRVTYIILTATKLVKRSVNFPGKKITLEWIQFTNIQVHQIQFYNTLLAPYRYGPSIFNWSSKKKVYSTGLNCSGNNSYINIVLLRPTEAHITWLPITSL